MERRKLWNLFLEQYCGCYKDSVGNRACDNGYPCDRCEYHLDTWNKLLKENNLEK